MKPGGRKFRVQVEDQLVSAQLDVLTESGGALRVLTKTVDRVGVKDGTLTVKLGAQAGQTLLNGIEIVRSGLPLDPPPSPARVPGRL